MPAYKERAEKPEAKAEGGECFDIPFDKNALMDLLTQIQVKLPHNESYLTDHYRKIT